MLLGEGRSKEWSESRLETFTSPLTLIYIQLGKCVFPSVGPSRDVTEISIIKNSVGPNCIHLYIVQILQSDKPHSVEEIIPRFD